MLNFHDLFATVPFAVRRPFSRPNARRTSMRASWNHRRRREWTCVIGRAAVTAIGLVTGASLQAAAQTPVTFAKDIAPILQRSCQSCHHTNGPAPMSLVTYEEVRPWAKSIQRKTAQREMPPWFIDKTVGIQKFLDDPSLSDHELSKIAAWVERGAPQGNPADMPPPRRFASGNAWSIGTPDLIVSSPVMTVKAVGADVWGESGVVRTGLTEDRYVQAIEVKEVKLHHPERYRASVVHHAAVTSGPPDTVTTVPGTGGLGNGRLRYTFELGQNATIYPESAGVLIEAGSAIYFSSTHLHSTGQEEAVRVDVGLKLHPKGYQPKYRQSGFVTMGQLNDELDIPAGEDNVRFDSFYRMPRPGILTTFEPHMHMSGKRMCIEVFYPDGKREMLNCADYNHNWVKVYVYEPDVAPLLPAGTMVHLIGWYNNSSSNPRVSEPRNWKGWGNRTIDDMFINLTKVTWLTEEEYQQELAARKAKQTPIAAPTAAAP